MWLLLFWDLCHTSLRMLSPLLCLIIKVFLGSWTWYISGPPHGNKFCRESPLPGTQWWQPIQAKNQTFSADFSQFSLNLYCIIIWSVVMRVSSWVCTTLLPNFIAIGWESGGIEAISCRKQIKSRTLPSTSVFLTTFVWFFLEKEGILGPIVSFIKKTIQSSFQRYISFTLPDSWTARS